MEHAVQQAPLLARCVVCRSDIHTDQSYEIWEGGYYCESHSLPWLWQRAREYAELLREQAVAEDVP